MSSPDVKSVDRRAERLGALLREADAPMPPIAYPGDRIARATRRRAVVRWSAAAAVVVLGSTALGVAPVRAWIVRAARVVWAAATGRGREHAGVPVPAGPRAASSVSFAPAGSTFTVRIAGRQSGGTLTLETAPGRAASAVITDGEGDSLVVVPDGLRIENGPGATASLLVRVPAATPRIAVSVGASAPRVFVPSGPGQRWVVDLRAGP